MATETTEVAEKTLPPKYIGSRISNRQYKLWLATAKKGPTNCPKGNLTGQKNSERAAIISMLDKSQKLRKKTQASK